jgi:lysophospholipase L1-like esterase
MFLIKKNSKLAAYISVGLLLIFPLSSIAHAEYLQINSLRDISCPTLTFCMAVGEGGTQQNNYSGGLAFVGKSGDWQQVGDTTFANYSSASLNSVSCVSENFCVAVGPYNYGGYNAGAWAAIYKDGQWQTKSIALGGNVILSRVSCTSVTFCMAVGGSQPGGYLHPTYSQVYIFDGTKWTSQDNFAVQTLSIAADVSCVSGTKTCVVAGAAPSYPGATGFLSQKYAAVTYSEGNWSSKVIAKQSSGQLTHISCPTVGYCLAAGVGYDDVDGRLLEFSDATGWEPIDYRMPVPLTDAGSINGISCGTVDRCVVITSMSDQPISFVKNGATWSTPTISPPQPASRVGLGVVSCVLGFPRCTAIGGYQSSDNVAHHYVAVFNGESWTTNLILEPLSKTPRLTFGSDVRKPYVDTAVRVEVSLTNTNNLAGNIIDFEVTAGPCISKKLSVQTDTSGLALFEYICDKPGSDMVTATATITDNQENSFELRAETGVYWTKFTPKYVAFGDSITTGGSIPTCKPDRVVAPWGCTATPNATPYPDIIAKAKGYTYSDVLTDYQSRSGDYPRIDLDRVGIWGDTVQAAAKAARLNRNTEGSWKPQLKAVVDSQELVTGALGVNDLHFSDVKKWVKLYLSSLTGDKISPAAQRLITERSKDFDTLFSSLRAAKDNGAKTVVTLYYNPYDTKKFSCAPLKSIGDRLVNTLDQELAQRATQNGLQVADFRPAFKNHGSGAQSSYVFGNKCSISNGALSLFSDWLNKKPGNSSVTNGFDPHPNNKGTEAMAQTILGGI